MKYQSELIKEMIDSRGHEKSSIHYQSECVETWIEENKGAYPKLCDYESEWLNYIVQNPIGEFPYETISTNTTATVNNVVPYAYKSAILKGNTLVNLTTQKSGSFNGTRFLYIPLSHTLKTNTKYFVKFNLRESSLTNGVACRLKIGTNGATVGTLISDGIITVTGEGYNYIEFYIKNAGDVTNGLDAVVDDIMLIEYQDGMENWDIPYFEGIQSVKMPVLTTTGKNLLNIKDFLKLENHTDFTDFGIGYSRSFVIKGEPNTTYVISRETNEQFTDVSLSILNSDGTRQALTNVAQRTRLITTTSDGRIYLSLQNITQDKLNTLGEKVRQIQVEIDTVSTATSYEPYKSNILTVNEDVTLRSNGSVHDELDLLTGKLTQRIDENGEVLSQEIVKTVDLTVTDENNQSTTFRPIEGNMHITPTGEPIPPIAVLEIPVEAVTQNLAAFIEEE